MPPMLNSISAASRAFCRAVPAAAAPALMIAMSFIAASCAGITVHLPRECLDADQQKNRCQREPADPVQCRLPPRRRTARLGLKAMLLEHAKAVARDAGDQQQNRSIPDVGRESRTQAETEDQRSGTRQELR